MMKEKMFLFISGFLTGIIIYCIIDVIAILWSSNGNNSKPHLKFIPGVVITNPEPGTIEFDGVNYFEVSTDSQRCVISYDSAKKVILYYDRMGIDELVKGIDE